MDTYEELESAIESQQNSLLFSVKQLLFSAEGIDVAEVESRRTVIKSGFQSRRDQAQTTVSEVEKQTERARQSGDPLPEGFDLDPEDLERQSEKLASFRTDNQQYLRSDEHETLASLSTVLADWAEYIYVKRDFHGEIDRVRTLIESLVQDAKPYVEYAAYLTAPDERRIRESISRVRDELATIRTRVNISVLADADRDRLARLDRQIDTITETVEGYNEEFVERQRDEYSLLFTNIDDDGHDLNLSQQRAVVRNGYYNQLIAGAGTGKTFALIYRVAYLVREDVDPDNIIALTYTNEAATEMTNRLKSEFGITNVEVSTIHSFGYNIVKEIEEEKFEVIEKDDKRNLIGDILREAEGRPELIEKDDKRNLIEDILREAKGDPSEFADHYLQFLYHYDGDFLDKTDFQDKTDYTAERREQSYETLAGETVASMAEKVIADFLFTHNVTYQYESIAEWADTADNKGAYRPDFYLPTQDIYIEHWGINENGEVAPWVSCSTEEYQEKLHWGRSEFENLDIGLINTYDFEHEAGRLKHALEHRLSIAGVEFDRMEFEEFVSDVFEYNIKKESIRQSFDKFIKKAKMFNIDPEEIPSRLDRSNPRQYHFGQCGKHMLEAYDAYLQRSDQIDFSDMIYNAIAAVEANPESFQSRYEHMLVDEFQDVAMAEIRLFRSFVGPEAETRLFCVGDDWQSIYSFQGSEVSNFINFDEHFGPPEPVHTRLTANYRCPETVIEASNDLIANNKTQISKTVDAHSNRDAQPVLHTLDGYQDRQYERRVGEYSAQLIQQFIDSGTDPGEIMVLCRYDGGASHIGNLKDELETRDIPYDGKEDDDTYRPDDMPGRDNDESDPGAGVSAFSVHQAKGREAEHVILLHAVAGPKGFPPDDSDDDLIAPVQDVATNTMAEERRLFYVALTRPTEDLHVMTRAGEESPFVEEIRPFLTEKTSLSAPGEEGDRLTVTARVERLWEDTHESKQQAGVLDDETGTRRFVSWKDDNPQTVDTDTWYRFEELRVDKYEGDTRVIIDESSTVVELFNEQSVL